MRGSVALGISRHFTNRDVPRCCEKLHRIGGMCILGPAASRCPVPLRFKISQLNRDMQASRAIIPRLTRTLRNKNPSALRSIIIPAGKRNMSLWHSGFPSATSPAPGFSSLFRMLDDFDRYAQQQLGSTAFGSNAVSGFSPKFDVVEKDKEYTLQGELPGVAPENVDIEFTDSQTMVVRGHSERQHTEGDPSLARLEAPEATKKIEGAKGKGREEAEGTTAQEAEGGARRAPRYWLSERSFGQFSRVFNFPSPVDQDNVRAKFQNGVLEVTVPKAERKTGRKIAIQ